MKTILQLIETSGPGGAENILISLAEHFGKPSYRSIICLLKDSWLSAKLQEQGIETVIIPIKRPLDFRFLLDLIDLIKRRGVNIMHSHEFTMNTYGSMASAITRIPIVTTVHGKNYYWEKWRRRTAYQFVSSQSSMVAVSEDIKKFLTRQLGIKNERVRTIYNGINVNLYDSDHTMREKVRRDLRIEVTEPIIGTVGNLYPVKGHHYLLKAAAIVISKIPSAKFIIAGRGALLDELKRQSIDMNIMGNLQFLGFREDISALLQAMDIFVLSSISEGLPLSVLEAMASGKPIVATNVGGIPEVVVDRQTGLLVPPENPAALAEKILFLIKNKEIADRFGKAGRIRLEKEFSLETMLRRYEEMYEECSKGL